MEMAFSKPKLHVISENYSCQTLSEDENVPDFSLRGQRTVAACGPRVRTTLSLALSRFHTQTQTCSKKCTFIRSMYEATVKKHQKASIKRLSLGYLSQIPHFTRARKPMKNLVKCNLSDFRENILSGGLGVHSVHHSLRLSMLTWKMSQNWSPDRESFSLGLCFCDPSQICRSKMADIGFFPPIT